MKQAMMGAMLLVMSAGSAVASEAVDLMCKEVGELAQMVMTIRQSGSVPMSDVLKIFADSNAEFSAQNADDAYIEEGVAISNKIGREIIIKAWDTPHVRTPEIRQKLIQDHRDRFEVQCHKSFQ